MPTVEFTKKFTWSPPERNGLTDVEYEPGVHKGVRRACAEAAVKAGAGSIIDSGEGEEVEDGKTSPEAA